MNAHPFIVLCDKWEVHINTSAAHQSTPGVSRKRACVELQAKLPVAVCFFSENHFYVKEWLTKGLSFWCGYLAAILSKMNKVILSFQDKGLVVFVANNGIWVYKRKLEFWKTCIFHHHELETFPIICLAVIITIVILGYCTKKEPLFGRST